MTDELERVRKETIVTYSWYCPEICLMGLRKIMETSKRDSCCPIGDLNRALPEYESVTIR
jgi:hypothetical protein